MKRVVGPKGALLLLVLALMASACRGGGGQTAGTGGQASEGSASEGGGASETGGGEILTDVGVTEEACPDAVNEDNGCIYLGTISDLTVGPFAPLAVPITEAQEAFWRRVNEEGGIGGYDINVTEFVRDNQYNPEVHNQVYQDIKGEVLALAQTLGSPTTAAIIEDLRANNIVAAPASWTSGWLYEDVILESGNTYCIESMNAVDYALRENPDIKKVMAVHLPGDYGADGAAGAKIAAEENGLEFEAVEQASVATGGTTTAAVDAVVNQKPDLVILTLTPRETAEVVGGAAARGFKGQFIGTSPSWNPALLESPAKDAMLGLFLQSAPWPTFESDTAGHEAMRETLGDVDGNDGYTSGWAWSYPLKAALEAAVEAGDLTREGLANAVGNLTSVDYEGMLPEGAGNLAGDPNEAAFRQTVFQKPTEGTGSGVELIEDFFQGPTAENFQFGDAPCYQAVQL
jgi:ABC-type branched-subunit amino acid transport system substrate-binding protein